jgi:prevent-host-death family protein
MRRTARQAVRRFHVFGVAANCYGRRVATTIPQRVLRNDVSAVLRRVAAGEEFIVTVSGRPVAELRPVVRKRRFVPTDELFAALIPPEPLSPEVLAGLRELDALVESMDEGDDRFIDP